MSKSVVEKLVVGSMAANCYFVINHTAQEALVIDPGDDPEYIIDRLITLKLKPTMIIATHGHFDHIMAARALQLAYDIPFVIYEDDVFLVANMQASAQHYLRIQTDPPPVVSGVLKNNETLTLGAASIMVLHTPGHTPGSICLFLESEKKMFVGDTIFAEGAVGRTDFSYSRKSDLEKSIQKIFTFPNETKLYPGHGEATEVGNERPFHRV